VRIVGTETVPSRPLIEYVLTTPGIHTLIIGIGQIDDDPLKCQLVQNYYAAQIAPNALDEKQRRELEKIGERARNGETNYFQLPDSGLTPPRNAKAVRSDKINLTWDASYAGDEPVALYYIEADGSVIGTVEHVPQTTREPFVFTAEKGSKFRIIAADSIDRRSATDLLTV